LGYKITMKLKKTRLILIKILKNIYKHEIRGKSLRKYKKKLTEQFYFRKYGLVSSVSLIINIKRGKSLINKKKYAKAEILLRRAKKKWPDNIKLFKIYARMIADTENLELTCKLWEEITIRFPDDEQSHFYYIMSLISVNRINTAYDMYHKNSLNFSKRFFTKAMTYIYVAWYDWDAALKVLRSLPGYDESNIEIRIREAEVLFESNKEGSLEKAIEITERLHKNYPKNHFIKITLAIFYVNAFRQNDAIELINILYPKNKHNIKVLFLYAWSKHLKGDENKANEIWNTLIKKNLIKRPPLYLYKGSLDRIDKNPLPQKPDRILLFTSIKNEIHRFPWFFEYYRKLGVDRFFIVDNGSNDGSTAYLKKQKDVHLFWTEYNYGQAGSGMQWINKLIKIYGKAHWCIYLDVDEALIFPGIEKRGLKYLTNYMKEKGHDAFRTFMLDMYPDNTKEIFKKEVDNPIAKCPYFDNNYQFFGSHNCPYIEVKGGIRNNLFNERVALTKTPIIAGNKEIKFINSSHRITPAVVSDVTGVLLHFKLMSDLGERSLEEFSKKNRKHFCNQRHLNYKNVLDKLGDDYKLVNPLTLRYKSSDQLVELGLITKPDDFG